MGDVAVIVQVIGRASRHRHDVDVGRVRREQQHGRCIEGPALQSYPAQRQASQSVCEWVHWSGMRAARHAACGQHNR